MRITQNIVVDRCLFYKWVRIQFNIYFAESVHDSNVAVCVCVCVLVIVRFQ